MEALTKYPSFAKFRTALERKRLAPTTLEGYINGIQNFVETLNLKDPEYAIEAIRQSEDREEFFNEAIDTLSKTTTNSRISNIFKALRYWLRVNGVVVDWDSVIIPTGEVVVEDRIPANEELKRILTIANIRDQAITLVASSSGLRLNTLLTLSVGDVTFDLPDIAKIMVKRVYTMDGKEYSTGRKISKKRKFFVTFVTPEARKALEAYLKWRKDEGEELTPESPLFTRMDKVGRGQFLDKHAFDVQWRKLLKRAHLKRKAEGSPWHTLHFHTLKKYTETKMIDAGVKRPYMEFFLGHKGGYLETNYFRGEEEKCIEEYSKAIPNLSVLEAPQLSEEERRIEATFDHLRLTGFSEDEIERYKKQRGETWRTAKELIIVVRQKATRIKDRTETNGGIDCEYKEIDENDLLNHLRSGWRVVHNLQNGKVIIQRG